MLHVDIPSRAELADLAAVRDPACVSLYLPTTPLTQDAQADRTALANLAKDALGQLREAGTPKAALETLQAGIDDLVGDDAFWAVQAHSLAVLATPERLRAWRLPNALIPIAEASDRFHLKPLIRAVSFPQEALVLALSQNGVRLVHVLADLPAETVRVPGMPEDAASAVGKASILDRAPTGRIQGSEGQKVHLTAYARQIDAALRPVLDGRETPLVLAGGEPLLAIFRRIVRYPHVAGPVISGNHDRTSDHDLAALTRPVIDALNRQRLEALHDLYGRRQSEDRATADLQRAARAATKGAVDTLLVDIDEVIPGTVDEADGTITFAEPGARSYGVVDEIARRALLTGGRVLGVRRGDLPGGPHLAAVLRWSV